MSSFAEQLAARAAKRTGGTGGGESNSISSPSRRSGSENLNNHGSSCASSTGSSSSPSRTATSLSEQIKSRAVDKSNTNTNGGQMTEISQKSISSATTNTTVSTDETLSFKSSSSTNPQKLTQQPKQTKALPIKIRQSSSSSSSRSKRSNEGNTNNLPVSQRSISRADINDNNDYDLLDGSDHMDEPTTSYIPAKLNQQHSTATKLRAKLEKYKSENKKLRHESLLLKAKLEEMATLLSQLESGHKVENDELKVRCKELSEKVLLLEMSSLNLPGGDDEYEWNGIRSSIMKLREERTKQQQRRSSLTTTTTNNSKVGRTYMLSADTFAEMDKEDLVAENVRLTQLMLDMEGLDELQRLANAQNVRGREHDIRNNEDEDGGKNANGTTSGDNDEKDAAITALNKKVSQIEEELTEVTDLKNAEIDVLRKQLNRVEQQQHNRNSHNSNNSNSNSPQDVAAINMEQQQQQWKKEREELREEIRRLNQEASRQMSNRLDQEEEEANARYNGTSSSTTSSSTSLFITSPKNLDKSDISSLQSIIGMMRQTIDQSNKEKEELEQRLAEEQERSQNELKAFAKTLEGVDDLRKSAETMSREIRRIKVKGYRPTRSDLMGGGGDLNGVRNFGELTAAVEASDCMEDAIRLIEGQNDALEERRRMGVVVASQSHGGSGAGAGGSGAAPIARRGVVGLRAISEDEDDDEGGFLSFWNGARRTNDDEDDSDAIAKREKKKKTKRKKKRGDEGSVFTSFF